MPLIVSIPDQAVMITAMFSLGQTFRAFGGTNTEGLGCVVYRFSATGENKFQPDAYALCEANGCKMYSGTFYTILTQEQMDGEVPEGFPDRMSGDDEPSPRIMSEYVFPTQQWLLEDGTWLVQVIHRPWGQTTQNGLTDDVRKIWTAEYGTLMVKAVGSALIPVAADPEVVS